MQINKKNFTNSNYQLSTLTINQSKLMEMDLYLLDLELNDFYILILYLRNGFW